MEKPGTLTALLKSAWNRLRGGELSPVRAASSVALGLLIGVTPLYGLHLVLVLAIALPLRLDARVAYLAANISLPFIAPFLSLAEIQIGARIATGHALSLDAETLRTHGVSAFVRDLVLGTAVFAPLVAWAGGSITFVLVSIFRTPSDFEHAVARIAARYPQRSAQTRTRMKMNGDPVTRAGLDLGPLEHVVDVGCGQGQLGLLLLDRGLATHVDGFDWDASKIAEARAAAANLPAHFERGDLRTHEIPPCDTVLLIDVLHYLTDDEQDALLERACRAAAQRIVVRDLDPDRGWRSRVTKIQEAITTTLRFNRGARIRVRPIANVLRVLEREGFQPTVTPCWEGTPFANVLVVATVTSASKIRAK